MAALVFKDKRERLLYELGGKKREHGIGRFCHNADEILVKDKIAAFGNHLYYVEFLQQVEKYKASENWYIMSCVLYYIINMRNKMDRRLKSYEKPPL